MCSGVVNLALEAVTLIESPIYLGMDGEPLSATAALIPQLREKYNIIGPRALSEQVVCWHLHTAPQWNNIRLFLRSNLEMPGIRPFLPSRAVCKNFDHTMVVSAKDINVELLLKDSFCTSL